MSIKSLFVIAGAVVLVAGCSNDMTGPTIQRTGARAAAAKTGQQAPTTTTPATTTTNGTANSTTEECRGGFVSLGREGDSVCVDNQY